MAHNGEIKETEVRIVEWKDKGPGVYLVFAPEGLEHIISQVVGVFDCQSHHCRYVVYLDLRYKAHSVMHNLEEAIWVEIL